MISPFVLAKIGAQARRYFSPASASTAETALQIGLTCMNSPTTSTAQSNISSRSCSSPGPQATRAAKRLLANQPTGGEELARIAAEMRARRRTKAYVHSLKSGYRHGCDESFVAATPIAAFLC